MENTVMYNKLKRAGDEDVPRVSGVIIFRLKLLSKAKPKNILTKFKAQMKSFSYQHYTTLLGGCGSVGWVAHSVMGRRFESRLHLSKCPWVRH